jgi:hypothetical protein
MGQFSKTTFSESIDVKRMILVGVVKEPGVEENRAFSDIDALWFILNSSKGATRKGEKRGH